MDYTGQTAKTGQGSTGNVKTEAGMLREKDMFWVEKDLLNHTLTENGCSCIGGKLADKPCPGSIAGADRLVQRLKHR